MDSTAVDNTKAAGRPPTEHTEEETARALTTLAVNEGNIAKTARELEVTPYMLRKLRDANYALYEEAQKRIVEGIFDKTIIMTDKAADEIISRLEDPKTLADMKIKELGVMFGIGVDKVSVMTTVRGKFTDTQQAVDDLSKLTEEEMQDIIDAEYRELMAEEPTSDEDLSDTPKDKLSSRPGGVSTIGSLLHRGSSERT
jgi:hypothetical protein